MTAQQDDRTPISRDTPASPRAEGEQSRKDVVARIYAAWMDDHRFLDAGLPYFWAELAADALVADQRQPEPK
jgi:hypothetical protein